MTIITYGGGEVLAKIVESIAMLFDGKGGSLLRGLMVLTMSLGGFWVIAEAFFSFSGKKIITKFFFPTLAILHLLLLPKVTIRIEDVTVFQSKESSKKATISVENVPFLLGKFATVVSTFGYKITQAIETVMHVPDDVSYNRTGQIFGAENLLDATHYKIQDADLENNFRSFVHQCVFYDLALEKYSIDELKKSNNLWEFLSNNTSKVRGIMFRPLKGERGEGHNPHFCSCREAMEKMRPYFEKERDFYAKSEVLGRLPLSYQALTGLQQNAEELISQQLVMNTITEDLEGGQPSFAKSRAYTKQRETFQILGSLTAKSLVTMRNVLEALIYASFLFIAPLSLLPNGMRYLFTWSGLVIWIQLWPPFFSILNYIMQIAAQSKVEGLFLECSGLSFFTSVGLRDLYSDMHAVAGYLAASIPYITYALLKGGVGSFVHLASSMMSPAHSAAASTAEEKTSGNYSFGNVNWGNLQAYNASAFKRHTAPTLSSGYFSDDTGKGGVTYSSDGEIFYRQAKSELRTSIQQNDSFTTALNEAHQEAQTLVNTESEQFADSINSFASTSASFIEHFSKNFQEISGINQQYGTTDQKAIHTLGNLAEKFGERFGLDRRGSIELLAAQSASLSGGLNVKFLKAGGDMSFRNSDSSGVTSSQVYDQAKDFVQTEQFQENWQQFLNQAGQINEQELSDEGSRYHQDLQSSFQKVQNSQESYQKSLSNMEQLSETISETQSHNIGVQHALDHSFIKWTSQREGSFEKARDVLDREDTDPRKMELIQEFVKSNAWKSFKISHESPSISSNSPKTTIECKKTLKVDEQSHILRKENLKLTASESTSLDFGQVRSDVERDRDGLVSQIEGKTSNYSYAKDTIQKQGSEIQDSVAKGIQKDPTSRTWVGTWHREKDHAPLELGDVYEGKKMTTGKMIQNLINMNKEKTDSTIKPTHTRGTDPRP